MVDTSSRNNFRKKKEMSFWSDLVVWGTKHFKNHDEFANQINLVRVKFGGSGTLKGYQVNDLINGIRDFQLSIKLATLMICAQRGWVPQTQQEKNITYSILARATDDYSLGYYLNIFPMLKLSDSEIAVMQEYFDKNKPRPKGLVLNPDSKSP